MANGSQFMAVFCLFDDRDNISGGQNKETKETVSDHITWNIVPPNAESCLIRGFSVTSKSRHSLKPVLVGILLLLT